MLKLISYDKNKAKRIQNELKLNDKRGCADALCCFLTLDFSRISGLKINPSLAVFQNHQPNKPCPRFNYACEYLQFNAKNNELEFKCGIYEKRSKICKAYPQEGFVNKPECIAFETFRNWMNEKIEAQDFYLFEKGTHNLNKFVVGKFRTFFPFKLYDIVPVPRNLYPIKVNNINV